MMLSYSLGYYFGYFAIMLICMFLAIILAKTKAGWFFYTAGVVLQFFSLLGITLKEKQMSYMYYYGSANSSTSTLWLIYLAIAVVCFFIVNFTKHKL